MRDPRFKEMTDYLMQLGTKDVEHTGQGFLAHLIGVYKDLERWGCDLDVCRAGMFHSIYGTELFQNFKLPLERRSEVRELIGDRAEWLAFLNCVMDRTSWDGIFTERTGDRAVIDRITGRKYRLNQRDFDDLTTIHVCDWLEQVPRSQDWDYRRTAYQAMAEYLGGIAAEECDRVYGLEAVESGMRE
jgi:hypothetical protein